MAQFGLGKHENVSSNLGPQFTFGCSSQHIFFSPAIKQIFAANCPDNHSSYKILVASDKHIVRHFNDSWEYESVIANLGNGFLSWILFQAIKYEFSLEEQQTRRYHLVTKTL